MDLDFVYDNYIWIIIVGVVLLMALIGFIAEKTNFGKEQFKKDEKKPKKKKGKKEVNEEVVIEEPEQIVIEEEVVDIIPEEIAEVEEVVNIEEDFSFLGEEEKPLDVEISEELIDLNVNSTEEKKEEEDIWKF